MHQYKVFLTYPNGQRRHVREMSDRNRTFAYVTKLLDTADLCEHAASLTITYRRRILKVVDLAGGPVTLSKGDIDWPRNVGRPAMKGIGRTSISLPQPMIDAAKAFGGGNLSAGVRKAITFYEESTKKAL